MKSRLIQVDANRVNLHVDDPPLKPLLNTPPQRRVTAADHLINAVHGSSRVIEANRRCARPALNECQDLLSLVDAPIRDGALSFELQCFGVSKRLPAKGYSPLINLARFS
jgi:hypothetical protein